MAVVRVTVRTKRQIKEEQLRKKMKLAEEKTSAAAVSSPPLKKQKIFQEEEEERDELLGLEETSKRTGNGDGEICDKEKKIYEDYRVSFYELGKGATATVVLCTNLDSREEFACKKMLKDDPDFVYSFYQEVDIMRHLSLHPHPGIVNLKDVYEDDYTSYLVMDLCEVGDLRNFIKGKKRCESLAAWITKCLMSAIKHCHAMGIVHRDVKPENVLFTKAGKLKLADFGLSTRIPPNGQLLSGVVGSMEYVAPEVLLIGEYTEKIDIWSAGIILHSLLVGSVPYRGETLEEMCEALNAVGLNFNNRKWESVSMPARDLVEKMLTKDVAKRLSAAQVLSHPWILSEMEQIAKARDIRNSQGRQCSAAPATIQRGGLFNAVPSTPCQAF